ncbi:MAG: neutral/alkaline non-lysosomal ceramidase N-terminal domain-containing protein [Anaerolineae bacterium]|nr:neutral/alkaline non-lysosomal ceramidase N-terminal domain-containing protein [Anaerolineae bacterium]
MRVGVAQVDITPPLVLPMDGYMARTGVSEAVHDPLLAQVLVLDDGSMRVALVTLDVLAVSAGFADPLRRAIAEMLGETIHAVWIAASHTHAGPAGLQDWFPIGDAPVLNAPLVGMIQERIIGAARQAINNLTPARLVYSAGPVESIGMDRNQPRPAPDPLVTAFRFDSLDSKLLAVLFHYACHPTVLGPQLAYSADFPGAARVRIQAQYPGAIGMFINGAAGNISTRFTRRDQTFDEVTRMGNLLGDRVIELLERADVDEQPALEVASQSIDLPIRPFSESSRSLQITGNPRIDQTRAEGAAIEAQLARAFADRQAIPGTLSSLQLGSWRLLSVPGEPFNELAAALYQVSSRALVVGYANDYRGYFPTLQAIDAQTYEALSSPYDARALDLIRQALIRLID